jgi:hypothetical protein
MSYGFGPFSGGMMGAAAQQTLVDLVAVGAQTSTTLTLTTKGALSGDIVWLFSPQSSGTSGAPGFVPSGSGWSSTSYSVGVGAVSTFVWKELSSTDAITITITGANFGFSYGIYRGPATCAIVIANDTDADGTDTDHAVTWPSKNAACVALVAIGYQASSACNLNAPVDWSDRNHAIANPGGAPLATDILDNLRPPSGGHTTTFSGTAADGGVAPHKIIGVELRT